MNKFTSPRLQLTEGGALPWLGAMLGAMLATWIIFQSHGIINRDGLLYVEAAKQFSLGQWKQGFALYPWPFYSLLIAALHNATGLGLLESAQALTVAAFALTSAGVITLAREVGGSRNAMLAAGLLLFCSTPLVDNYLPMVLRDHGFLAAHLWSIVFFLRFYRGDGWIDAIGWGIAAAAATLFRIEGIVYLAMLPLVLLLRREQPWQHTLAALFRANWLLIGGAAALGIHLLLHPEFDTQKLGRLKDPITVGATFLHQISEGLGGKAQIYADRVLGEYLDDFALPGLLLTLAFALLLKAVTSAGWIHLAFAAYSRLRRKDAANPRYPAVINWLLLIGLINSIVIILSVFVLPKRYLLPIGMIILLYAAFGAASLFEKWRHARLSGTITWAFPVAAAFVALQLVSLLWPSSPKERFEMDAARWVTRHAAANSRIYYDDGRLHYYATGESVARDVASWEEIEHLLSSNDFRQFDYLLVHVPRSHPERESYLTGRIGSQPLASFANSRGKRVLIYRAGGQGRQ